jgi:hypothetical protein
MASRFLAGATSGAIIGGTWGAISDRESILGGAMKGAFVGGMGRVAFRGLNWKSMRGLTKLTQSRGMMSNLRMAWGTMNVHKNQAMRNWIVGMGLVGAAQGMISGDDNPIGGAVGGAIAGGIRGAAIYGGYRGYKRWRGWEGPVLRSKSLAVI